jgi:hypothetical protein
MFWRILAELFRASRGRLAVALLAIASGAAVTTALLNLNWDAERKVSAEFRTLGANIVFTPQADGQVRIIDVPDFDRKTADPLVPKDDALASPLLSEFITTRIEGALNSYREYRQERRARDSDWNLARPDAATRAVVENYGAANRGAQQPRTMSHWANCCSTTGPVAWIPD